MEGSNSLATTHEHLSSHLGLHVQPFLEAFLGAKVAKLKGLQQLEEKDFAHPSNRKLGRSASGIDNIGIRLLLRRLHMGASCSLLMCTPATCPCMWILSQQEAQFDFCDFWLFG